MFYLDIVADGRNQTLCFASKKDAVDFSEFTKIYVDDSGAGNGYGAYWLWLDAQPYYRPYRKQNSVCLLNLKLVSAMLWSILSARLAISNPATIGFSQGSTGEAVTFSVDSLPPRLRPSVGDMYRIPRSKMSPDLSESGYSEGRIMAENNETFILRSCSSEEPSRGNWRGDQKTYMIACDRVMKINDWLMQMRYPS